MKAHRRLVFDKMIECIAKGVFRPNEKLYSENRLARVLGVGRSDVREALMALELMGAVRSFQGKGTFLIPFELNESANPFALMIMLKQGNPDEIMAARRLIEPEVTRLCALHRSQDDLKRLERSLHHLENSPSPELRSREDAGFHSIVAAACGNRLLHTLMNMIFGYISYVSFNNWATLARIENSGQRQDILDQHRAVFLAIRDGDSAAAVQAAQVHLDYIGTHLNQKIREEFDAYEKQKSLSWP